MAAAKDYKQYFEDFRGIDRRKSHLTRAPNAATAMTNLEMLENQSLIARQGCKVTGQPWYIRQIHTYSAVDENGVVTEKIIGAGAAGINGTRHRDGFLYELVTTNITVTRSVSASFDWQVVSDVAYGGFKFNLYEGAVSVYNTDLGSGLAGAGTTIQGVCTGIDALANYTCVAPKTAIVSGNQTIAAFSTALNVLAGHTISPGDYLYFVDSATGEASWIEVTNTTATTLVFPVFSGKTISVVNAQVIGLGALPAANCLPLRVAAPTAQSSVSIPMTYWQIVPGIGNLFNNTANDIIPPFGYYLNNVSAKSPSFVNYRNCTYVTSALTKELEYKFATTYVGGSTTNTVGSYKVGVWKYDGKDFYMSGLPMYQDSSGGLHNISSVAAGVLTGTYRYKLSYSYIDAQGNEIILVYPSYSSQTVTAKQVTLNVLPLHNTTTSGYVNSSNFNFRGGNTTTIGVSTNTFTLPTGHTLRAGHKVYVITSTSEAVIATVESSTPTQVVLDTSVNINSYNIDNNNIGNVKLRLWRTKNSGADFFLCQELISNPHSSTSPAVFIDNLADGSLGIPLSSVDSVGILTSLPRGNAITVHQGCLVVGGGGTIPKQIAWEDPAFPEMTDQATRLESLPFTRSGDINVLAGDVGSSLLVIGPSSQFNIRGSLSEVEYEIEKVYDTGKGAAGPQCVAIAEDSIYILGKQGLTRIVSGINDVEFGNSQLPLLLNNAYANASKLSLDKAVLFHDDIRHRIHFFIPAMEASVAPATTPTSLYLVYDIPNKMWYEFTYGTANLLPIGGLAIANNISYHQSWTYDGLTLTGYTFKRLDKETSDLKQDYIDNAQTYPWELSPQWDDGNYPKVNKVWQELSMYMLQPSYFAASFQVLVNTFRNWSTTTASSTRTLSFDTAATYEAKCKFNADTKAQRLQFKFSGTVNKNPPIITGYEYTVVSNVYTKDRMAE